MTAVPNADVRPVQREYEKPTEVPCAGCGQPVALTWTKSAEGHGVYHGRCYLARMEER